MDHRDFAQSEQASINGIIKQLDGLPIALAHDTLNKVHLILSLTETPIDSIKVRAVWFPEDQNEIKTPTSKETETMNLLIQNGKEYHGVVMNNHIELYLWVDLWYAKFMPCACLYYKLPSELISKVKKLTRMNLLHDFGGTPFEQKLVTFLKKHHPCKKERKTGDYKLLGVFVANEFTE